MTIRYRQASLIELIDAAQAIAAEAQQEFGGLSLRQLNWKPYAQSWSVGQCFDHLLTTNAEYLPIFENVRSGHKRATLFEHLPLLPRFWARLMIDAVSPEAPRKLRAPKIFQPAQSEVDGKVIRRFAEQQEALVVHFLAVERLGLGCVVVTSPVSRLITYSLLDACRILVAHERRHFEQASRVTKNPEFP